MNYIGLDPGKNGGIAVVDMHGRLVLACRMPEYEVDILAVLREYPDARAALEFVRSSPQMGVTSAFTFGQGYGGLRMALAACGIPYDELTPRRWQKVMGCLSHGDKNTTKRRARELFPQSKVTHAIADAMLLAECARRLDTAQQWSADALVVREQWSK